MTRRPYRFLVRLGPPDISWRWQHHIIAALAVVLVPLALSPLILAVCDPLFAQDEEGLCTILVIWGPGAFFGLPALAIGVPVFWALRESVFAGALPIACTGAILGAFITALSTGGTDGAFSAHLYLGAVGAVSALIYWIVLVAFARHGA